MAYDPSQRKANKPYPNVFAQNQEILRKYQTPGTAARFSYKVPDFPIGSTLGTELGQPFNGDPSGASSAGAVSVPDLPAWAMRNSKAPTAIPPLPPDAASSALADDVNTEASQLTPPEPPPVAEFQGPPLPDIQQQIEMEQRRHLDFLTQQHAELDALENPGVAQEAIQPPITPTPSRPPKRPAQFVSAGNKPQWNDVLGGGEQDHLYGAFPTAGTKDTAASKSHVYAPSTESFYQRALDRFNKTGRSADARRVNTFNARLD